MSIENADRNASTGGRKPPVVLAVAGSDPSGGAGIQADIKTCSSFGVYAMAAVTALTVQNTHGVEDFTSVSPEFIASQISVAASDIRPDAVKVGMLPSAEAVKAVAGVITELGLHNVVTDPLLISSSGRRMNDSLTKVVDSMKSNLFPFASLVTPNLPEALAFIGQDINEHLPDPVALAVEFMKSCGCRAVLLKGGHMEGDMSVDTLVSECSRKDAVEVAQFAMPRIDTVNSHGTGCVLSSAIACSLAMGRNMVDSVLSAKKYLSAALLGHSGVAIGSGHGPVDFNVRPALDYVSDKSSVIYHDYISISQ